MTFDIKKVPMVRVTWLDARDTETGWLDIKGRYERSFSNMSRSWLVNSQ